ncbi:MAG: asparagine synthase (glutamine-hydrolyzing) [Desulfobulbia bacterium]|jgi:asparagine synthase (glutamine-hydrolysing)
MCGIAGWLGDKIDAHTCTEMLARLAHRGPDGEGEWRADGVWLGHRRLAVLDLSSEGRQPMLSPSRRYALTYNGEVYNYLELRVELERNGVHFRGHSDTEVVLAACELWGVEKAVTRLEGMFAFALYDVVDHVLWLARDPMGIKPLYYANTGSEFAFASELTALQPLPWLDDTIDADALYAYFRYLTVPSPASILRGARKLPSGTLLRWDGCILETRRFWDVQPRTLRASSATLSFEEATDELEKRLRHSVRWHMQSDVPYGAFLSGGVDSSVVAALMQAESSRPIKTFTVGFSERTQDESPYARAVAAHLGTEHHELILNADDVPALVPEVASHYDEPFADGSSIPTFLVSRFARQHVTVCLSGDGGDELFAGYPRYFWAGRVERWRNRLTAPGAYMASRLLQGLPDVFWNRVMNSLTGKRYAGTEGLAPRIKRFARYLGCAREQAYPLTMSAWPNPEILLGVGDFGKLGADAASYPNLSWAEEMMLTDQENYLQDDILAKVDRASMAVSLEARVPLLIHSLVEWSWDISLSYKVKENGDQGKRILREVLYRHVPRELIERPKQGFGMPMAVWLRGPLRDWAEALLTSAELESAGLNAKVVQSVWKAHLAGENRLSQVWTVLMYRQWQETWKQGRVRCAG